MSHKEVWMARKQLRFLTREHNREIGVRWYREQFSQAPPEAVLGDASNAYARDPLYTGAPEAAFELLPQCRLIYIVREPHARIVSHYRHRLVTGQEWRSFNRAVHEDPSYLVASLYRHQIACWRKLFPADRLLVLRFESMVADPKRIALVVEKFFGLTHDPKTTIGRENASTDRKISPTVIRLLRRLSPRSGRLIARVWQRNRFIGKWASDLDVSFSSQTLDRLNEELSKDRLLLAQLAGEDIADFNSVPTARLPTIIQSEPTQTI